MTQIQFVVRSDQWTTIFVNQGTSDVLLTIQYLGGLPDSGIWTRGMLAKFPDLPCTWPMPERDNPFEKILDSIGSFRTLTIVSGCQLEAKAQLGVAALMLIFGAATH